jgi:hypothetical protein
MINCVLSEEAAMAGLIVNGAALGRIAGMDATVFCGDGGGRLPNMASRPGCMGVAMASVVCDAAETAGGLESLYSFKVDWLAVSLVPAVAAAMVDKDEPLYPSATAISARLGCSGI